MSTQPLTLSLDTIVDVVVEISPLVPSPPQFNQGLIVGPSTVIPSWSVTGSSRLKRYTSVTDMVNDGFILSSTPGVSSPEVVAAQMYFGQQPAPLYLWVGVCDQTGKTIVTAVVSAGGTGYTVGDVLTISGGTGGRFRVDTVNAGAVLTGTLVANGTTYTASASAATSGGTGTGCTLTTTVGNETLLQAVQYCRAASSSWYGVYVCGAQLTDNKALGDWAESSSPPSFYFFDTADATVPTQPAVGSTDVFSYLKAAGRTRCIGVYSTDQGGVYPNNLYSAAALMGKALGLNSGLASSYFTLKFKPLSGVAYEPLSSSQIGYICGTPDLPGKNGNVYSNYANTYTILHEGVVPSGAFFDEIINIDLLRVQIQYNVMNVLMSVPAIPQTDVGQTQLIHAVNQALDEATLTGFISPGVWEGPQVLALTPGTALPKGYMVQSQAYALQTPADRAARKSMPIYASIIESGAVHFVTVGVYVQR